jgi:hypothetical protein
MSRLSRSHRGGHGMTLMLSLMLARSHLDSHWSTVHIPSLTSTLPVSSCGRGPLAPELTTRFSHHSSSHCRAGGLAAWVEDAMSKALWWHLGRIIAAAARSASLPAEFMQDLHQRMRKRSVFALVQLLISARVAVVHVPSSLCTFSQLNLCR